MNREESAWSDEHVSAAHGLLGESPFVHDEAEIARRDEAAEVLEEANEPDQRTSAAALTLAGPAYVPHGPLHVMGGGSAVLEHWSTDLHHLLSWPEGLFVPGNSTEKWLGFIPCPPDHRYASGSSSGFPSQGDPQTGRAWSWAQPPRRGVTTGVTSAGVFAFFRPTVPLSLRRLAPEIAWLFESRYVVLPGWARDYVINVRMGGSVSLSAWVWNTATNAWERATNGLGGTPVSATRQIASTTDSGLSGSVAASPVTFRGHIDSGRFNVPVLVESGRLYAFGVHANSWWQASFVPAHPSVKPTDPPPGEVRCWTSMLADVPAIWL